MGIRDYEFRGRTYDQWELGEEYITGARTITEADIGVVGVFFRFLYSLIKPY